jgi:hypothetical protein
MLETINNSGIFMQIAWYTALITTFIFLIQAGMTFFGGDLDHGADINTIDTDVSSDVDVHADDIDNAQNDTGFTIQWFTFRNLITLLMFFAWGTIAGNDYNLSQTASVLLGLGLGLLMVFITTLLYAFMKRLQTNNIPNLKSIVGKTATVYLRIPKGGAGKITVTANGSLQTISAITEGDSLKTGETVTVVRLLDESTAVVSKL